jgi:hypothetical protein
MCSTVTEVRQTVLDTNSLLAFGVPLLDLCKRRAELIPAIVRDCIAWLDNKGLQTEEIFRLSPDRVAVNDVIVLVEQGAKIDFTRSSPHLVAEILKRFYREVQFSS